MNRKLQAWIKKSTTNYYHADTLREAIFAILRFWLLVILALLSYASFSQSPCGIPLSGVVVNPQSITKCTSVSVAITASSIVPGYTFQWQVDNGSGTFSDLANGANYSHVTTNTLNIALPLAGIIKYRLVVSNGTCYTFSGHISLTGVQPPIIISQPDAMRVCSGDDASVSVVAVAGAGTITYQWRKNGINIMGANSATLTLSAPSISEHLKNYSVIVSQSVTGCLALSSTIAPLFIYTPISIATQPVSLLNVCETDSRASLDVAASTATNALSIYYQWKKNGIDIPGATTSTYLIPPATNTHAGTYTVVVRAQDFYGNNYCPITSITSDQSEVTVIEKPEILTQPGSQTLCQGQDVIFTVNAGVTTAPAYQWKKNGLDIPGATSSAYSITGLVPADAGNYSVVVSGTCTPAVTSNVAILTVRTLPLITTEPLESQVLCEGNSVSFNVHATGTNLTYQWKKNGTDITGATFDSYTIPETTNTDAGDYIVVVSGACSPDAVSTNSSLTIKNLPSIVVNPATSMSVCEGSVSRFDVIAAGTDITYQWQKNGADLVGATSNTLTIPEAQIGNEGTYTVVVRGCGLAVTSSQSILSVHEKPEIITGPATQVLCQGQNVTLTVNAGVTTAPIYQWRKNGNTIPGATNSTYPITGLTQADGGNYSVVVGGSCTPVITSTDALLTVRSLTSITRQPVTSQSICEGSITNLSVIASGTNNRYQWRKNNTDIPGATTGAFAIPTTTIADAGTYSVVVTGACAPSATSFSSVLEVFPVPQVVADSDKEIVIKNPVLLNGHVTSSSASLDYQWTPAENLNDATILTPLAVPTVDTHYTLLVTDENGCSASDDLYVKVLTPLTIPNAFSPNGDGRNDAWRIDNVEFYPGATVEVFNRHGETVFYTQSNVIWNGTYKGSSLPWGTYYYIINLKDGSKPVCGWVAIIK